MKEYEFNVSVDGYIKINVDAKDIDEAYDEFYKELDARSLSDILDYWEIYINDIDAYGDDDDE